MHARFTPYLTDLSSSPSLQMLQTVSLSVKGFQPALCNLHLGTLCRSRAEPTPRTLHGGETTAALQTVGVGLHAHQQLLLQIGGWRAWKCTQCPFLSCRPVSLEDFYSTVCKANFMSIGLCAIWLNISESLTWMCYYLFLVQKSTWLVCLHVSYF